jgi:hypothetical protein
MVPMLTSGTMSPMGAVNDCCAPPWMTLVPSAFFGCLRTRPSVRDPAAQAGSQDPSGAARTEANPCLGQIARHRGHGKIIAESGAIIDYVLRHYGNGRLAPAPPDPNYDDYVHWMHYAEGSGMPALIIRINVARVGEAAAPALPRLDGEIALQLGYLDGALKATPTFLAKRFRPPTSS